MGTKGDQIGGERNARVDDDAKNLWTEEAAERSEDCWMFAHDHSNCCVD